MHLVRVSAMVRRRGRGKRNEPHHPSSPMPMRPERSRRCVHNGVQPIPPSCSGVSSRMFCFSVKARHGYRRRPCQPCVCCCRLQLLWSPDSRWADVIDAPDAMAEAYTATHMLGLGRARRFDAFRGFTCGRESSVHPEGVLMSMRREGNGAAVTHSLLTGRVRNHPTPQ
jgi:hypothetical protein